MLSAELDACCCCWVVEGRVEVARVDGRVEPARWRCEVDADEARRDWLPPTATTRCAGVADPLPGGRDKRRAVAWLWLALRVPGGGGGSGVPDSDTSYRGPGVEADMDFGEVWLSVWELTDLNIQERCFFFFFVSERTLQTPVVLCFCCGRLGQSQLGWMKMTTVDNYKSFIAVTTPPGVHQNTPTMVKERWCPDETRARYFHGLGDGSLKVPIGHNRIGRDAPTSAK